MVTMRGFYVFVFLEMLFAAQGNNDIIVRVEDSDDNFLVSFPPDHFSRYHTCLCEKRRKCNGVYGEDFNIYEVDPEGNMQDDRRCYLCEKNGRTICCSRKDGLQEGSVNQVIKCQTSDIGLTLVWKNKNEGFIFGDHGLCEEYCVSGCYCLVSTTSSTLVTSFPPTATNSAENDLDDSSSLDLIIGVVIAVIIIAIVIAVIGILLWRRKKRPNTSVQQTVTKDSRSLPLGRATDTHGSAPYSVASVQAGMEMSALPNGEYGYSTVQDQAIDIGGYQTVSVPSYKLAGDLESQSKDPGYELAGPESGYDTATNNKAAQPTQDETLTTGPGSSSTVASLDKPKDIYNRLHEDNRQVQNPYNTLLQSTENGQDSQTATNSDTDQSKSNYTRLHEEKRRFQNPYNTLLKPIEDAGSSQTANQSSRYSFAQPTFNKISNENTDDNAEVHNVETSQKHTYHILEASTDDATDERKEGGATAEKKRNNYFELEKQ